MARFIVSDNKFACSNNFEYEKPTYASPDPTMLMNIRKALEPYPKKRRTKVYKKPAFDNSQRKDYPFSAVVETRICIEVQCSILIAPAMVFADLTRDCDVTYSTALTNIDAFRLVFNYLSEKASVTHYWKGISTTLTNVTSTRNLRNSNLKSLTLEQEFSLTLMRLQIEILNGDLGNRFKASSFLVSIIFARWIKLMSLEVEWFINCQ